MAAPLFSVRMLEIVRGKLPDAVLLQRDLTQGLPPSLMDTAFDAVVCTYAIHHLTLTQKIDLLRSARARLLSGGTIYIGDVAFATNAELTACRSQCGDEWDEDELYPTVEQLRPYFPELRFTQISFCAGVFQVI